MDSRLWSRLPREVVAMIIWHATTRYYDSDEDEDGDVLLQKWLSVVRGNRMLHGALLSQHWKEVNIFWTELMLSSYDEAVHEEPLNEAAANEAVIEETVNEEAANAEVVYEGTIHEDMAHEADDEKRANLMNRLSKNSKHGLIRELMEWDHGVRPLPYINVLRFRLLQEEDELEEYLPPSHRMIQHTIGLILPALEVVREILIEGPVSDTIFEAIASVDNPRLQRLQVGAKWCDYRFQDANDGNDRDLNTYDWTKLGHLKCLRELEIRQITKVETRSIANLIPKLISLETLSIAPCRNRFIYDPLDPTGSSPLQSLFSMETRYNLLSQLPVTLKSLEIQDHYHLGLSALQIPEPTEAIDDLSQCSLKSLLTELDDLQCTRDVLKWLPHAQLEQVSFSPVLSFSSSSGTSPLTVANEIISLHQSTLKKIILTNAWKIDPLFASRFAEEWSGLFEITELVLATDCIPLPDCMEPHVELKLQSLKHVLFGCIEDVKRWGLDIQRLRLEMPWSAHDMVWPDRWNIPSMQKLRILIVSPRNDCSQAGISAEHHEEIAHDIAEAAPSSLQFIQLCQFRFWIVRDKDGRAARVVRWRSAYMGDEDQSSAHTGDDQNRAYTGEGQSIKRQILSWLTKEDEEFILPDSPLNLPRVGFNSRWRMEGHAGDQHPLQTTNFMVARRCF